MFRPLIRYADFKGRSRRSEFWQFYLLIVLATVVCACVGAVAENAFGLVGTDIMLGGLGPIYLAAIIPWYAVMIRRLHDVDKSAWWLLTALIPFGVVALLMFWGRDGTSGDNRFGPDPKASGTAFPGSANSSGTTSV
jgi:uncharacterized membrane protein YhaH (DUF805 family)